jgi:hypothetical protein
VFWNVFIQFSGTVGVVCSHNLHIIALNSMISNTTKFFIMVSTGVYFLLEIVLIWSWCWNFSSFLERGIKISCKDWSFLLCCMAISLFSSGCHKIALFAEKQRAFLCLWQKKCTKLVCLNGCWGDWTCLFSPCLGTNRRELGFLTLFYPVLE